MVPWLMADKLVPGVAAVRVNGDAITTWHWGTTRAGTMEPVTADTVFEAASLGKPVFAYAVMTLVRGGEFDLDTPLVRYFGRPYIENDPRVNRITARHVLSHSTGFPNWRPRHWTANPGDLTMDFTPGERFRYSGEGYVYLQRVAEKITGQDLQTFVERRVFDPLGMTRSTFAWSIDGGDIYAHPHDGDGHPRDKHVGRTNAASSLHTTTADLGRFLQAMLREGTAEIMLAPQIDISDPLAWSLGWGLEHQPGGDVFWQWGDNGTFHHFMAGSRHTGRAAAVLTNGRNGTPVYRVIIPMLLGHDMAALHSRFLGD